MAVTTALCADRVAVAAPAARPPVAQLAGQLVDRLTQSFRRTVAVAVPLRPERRVADRSSIVRPRQVASVALAHPSVSAFQFRLPPPLV